MPREAGDRSKQEVRFHRYLLAATAYAVCVPPLYLSYRLGLIHLWPMLDIVAAIIGVNAVLFAAFRSGFNERFRDPSLAWPQTVAAIIVLMTTVYHFDYDRGMALRVSFMVLGFGVFRFTLREFLRASAVVLAGYALVINLLMWFKPATVDPYLEGVRWLTLAVVLPCFAIVCGRISELRQRLVAMNEQLQEAIATIQTISTRDALTGLPNRASFSESLAHAIAASEHPQRSVGVLFMDIDRFKYVNDTLGHDMGDRVLGESARRLLACVRTGDTVARLGGDEFGIVIEDFKSVADLTTVADKVLAAFQAAFVVDAHELALSASIGISAFPEDGKTAALLLSNADLALYRAKEQGRNRHSLFAADLNAASQERLALESALRHAVERQELELHYQPKIDLRSGRVTGVEALVRWRHPQRGLLSPDRFIPLAEEIGAIVPMGLWTLRHVCERIKAWQSLPGGAVPVAVNLSASQFHQPTLPGDLAALLQQTGIAPQMLEIEITESMVMHDPDSALAVMESIRDMGSRLAIDDFGTGYSSLGYLKRFPIDRLKIDRMFIRDLPHNAGDIAITRAVIAMAHSLRMSVVAEGVEEESQYELLRREGCDEYQGYYCRPPLPETDLLKFLAEERSQPARVLRQAVEALAR